MPPTNFARKKRKSRSRGSSAKRASHNRGEAPGFSSKKDKRSSSADVNSESSRELEENLKDGHDSQVKADAPEESPILSLAHNVATAAIATAETAMKSFPSRKTSSKKDKPPKVPQSVESSAEAVSSRNSVQQNLNSDTTSHTLTMVQEEEEKLNNLCKLLERLDSTYGKNSCPSSPIKVKSVKEDVNTCTRESSSSSPKKKWLEEKDAPNGIAKEGSSVRVIIRKSIANDIAVKKTLTQEAKEKSIPNDAVKEGNVTQEEKQALRKAKKEAKKMTKQGGAKTEAPSESEKMCNHSSPMPTHAVRKTPSQSGSVLSKIQEEKVEKSKAELKRERREKQEAQRAAKETAKATQNLSKSEVVLKEKVESRKDETVVKKTTAKRKDVTLSERHLPLLEHLSTPKTDHYEGSVNSTTIHPAVRAVGLSMRDLTVDGCISRVLATLSAICGLIEDYQTPPSCDLSRDLSSQLFPNIAFLNSCRPISEPMNNTIRFVKREINKVHSSVPEMQAKEELLEAIQTYIHQNIVLASETIIQNALQFIEDNDVILTFGFSSLVYETVKAAAMTEREKLCVVVVDNPGAPSGVNLLQSLVQLGIKVYYRILPDLPHIINKVTKVVVEAEAVVLNGAVIGRCGMAGLILLASCRAVPVIALSHTFKFCNIDLTDSLVVNELGDATAIVDCPSSAFSGLLAEWKDSPSLNVVNLIYDVTPSHLINVLVTERNNFPTSVVPVIIKRNYADILGHD